MNKPLRLSHTQISMYLDKCPRQYAYRYIEHMKLRPSGAMLLGRVGHEVIEDNYRQKVTSGVDAPVDEVADRYASLWKESIEAEETIFNKDEKPNEVRDEGISATKKHRTDMAPWVIPAGADRVEEPFDLPLSVKGDNPDNPVRYSIIGKIDLTDAAGTIRDNKIASAKRHFTPELVAASRQLSIYAIAQRIKRKQPETGVALDVVRMMKKGPLAISIPGVRTHEYLLEELNTIGHVARGIEHHVFPKRTDGWWCSARWCGYYGICQGKNLKVVDMGQSTGKTDGTTAS